MLRGLQHVGGRSCRPPVCHVPRRRPGGARHTVFLVFFEVFQNGRHLPASHVALSDVPLEDRCKLQSRQLTRSEAVRSVGYFADALRARLIEVTLRDVRRVEVDHGSSRSSDWYTAESTGASIRRTLADCRRKRTRSCLDARSYMAVPTHYKTCGACSARRLTRMSD